MAKIIKVEPTTPDGYTSYQIDFGDNMILWFDSHHEDEDGGSYVTGDWNKYIFFTDNEQDMKEKAFQDANDDEVGAYNHATAIEIIEEYEANNS